MARLTSPALAFYLNHARDCDALWGLDDAPKGVPDDDWKKFVAVKAKANEQAAELLIACREEIITLFIGRFNVASRMSVGSVQTEWASSASLTPKSAKGSKVWVGCGLGCGLSVEQPGDVFLYPYVDSPRASERAGLRARLQSLRLSFLPLPADQALGDECIVLSLIPFRPETDLDEAMAACVKPFLELAKGL